MQISLIDDLLPIYNETLYVSKELNTQIVFRKGDFEKKILVLCKHSDWNPDHQSFLHKILVSCRLTEKDFLLLVVKGEESMLEIINQYHPEILLLFGLELKSASFKLFKKNYKPFQFNNIKIVLSDSLEILKTDKEKRNALWNISIKPLFNIS